MRKSIAFKIAITILAVVLVGGGNQLGFWWLTIPTGILLGFVLKPRRAVYGIALLVGAASWGFPLMLLALQFPIGRVASFVAGFLGLGGAAGWIPICTTIVLGMVLCSCGAYLGSGLRQLGELVVGMLSSISPAQKRTLAKIEDRKEHLIAPGQ